MSLPGDVYEWRFVAADFVGGGRRWVKLVEDVTAINAGPSPSWSAVASVDGYALHVPSWFIEGYASVLERNYVTLTQQQPRDVRRVNYAAACTRDQDRPLLIAVEVW